MVLQTEIARQKKVSRLKYTDGFILSVIVWRTDKFKSSVKLSMNVWNTDRRYPSVHSSVIVAGTVKDRQITSVGKVVGECIIPTEYIRL
jgi:ribonuclease HII